MMWCVQLLFIDLGLPAHNAFLRGGGQETKAVSSDAPKKRRKSLPDRVSCVHNELSGEAD